MPTCTSMAASRRSSLADDASSNIRRFPVQTSHPATTPGPETPTRRWRGVAAVSCIAALLLGGLSVKHWLNDRTPSPDADAGRLSRYMAGPAFTALSDAQKAPYLEAFRRASDRGELTPQQQRGVLSN